MQNCNVLYYGRETQLPKKIALNAGPLSMFYEYGDLRYIRLGMHEILRRIYVASRDHNWDTAPNQIKNERFDLADDSFQIQYEVENRWGEIDFIWQASITGDKNGTVTFSFEGEAQRSYLHNRTGFCLLHPIRECSGNTFWVEQADGTVKVGEFPVYLTFGEIQPFTDMRSMRFNLTPGIEVSIQFSGDLFEMEDQRNWTDGSYKTYCTPLRLPMPVQIQAGQKISQTIIISIKGSEITGKSVRGSNLEAVQVRVDKSSARKMPGIGLGFASNDEPLKEKEIERLKTLNLAHLRLDLIPSQTDASKKLGRAIQAANEIKVPLEIALFLEDAENDIQELAALLKEVRPPVCRWLIFGPGPVITREALFLETRSVLKELYPDVPVGGGTNANFAELNQFRAPFQHLDFVCYSINPQVHTYDNDSLVENLESQALTVESAKMISGGLPTAVSPVTLKMRFNPDAIGPAPEPAPGELPPQVDVRQMSLFGAGWTVGSLRSLAESGLSSITYYETTGWRGVMETEAGSPIPEKFQSIPGGVFPVYHVLDYVSEFSDGEVLFTSSSDPLRVIGLAMRKDGRSRLIVANLTPTEQKVDLMGMGSGARVKMLDEWNAEEAMRSPESFRTQKGNIQYPADGHFILELLPYGIARIDWKTEEQ